MLMSVDATYSIANHLKPIRDRFGTARRQPRQVSSNAVRRAIRVWAGHGALLGTIALAFQSAPSTRSALHR